VQLRKPPAGRQPIAVAAALAAALAVVAVGVARAATAVKPSDPGPSVVSLRSLVGHYRTVTWTFERVAHVPRVRSSYVERRTHDRDYLRWVIDRWTRRAYVARSQALAVLHRRLAVQLPRPPGLRASLQVRVAYSRRLALALRRIYPGHVERTFASAGVSGGSSLLRLWNRRSAVAALEVARHARPRPDIPPALGNAFLCIHRFEAAWNANTGNGYYGGLQMDLPFQARYGARYLGRYGTADRWPVWAQLDAAVKAYRSGRGFWPWPNTARACGLL
jgi:hypothetical protein